MLSKHERKNYKMIVVGTNLRELLLAIVIGATFIVLIE